MTALLCAPLGPYEPLTSTPLPSEVLAKAVASASYAGLGTEYATRRTVPPPLPPDELEHALTPTAAAIVAASTTPNLRVRERDVVIRAYLRSKSIDSILSIAAVEISSEDIRGRPEIGPSRLRHAS